MAEQKLQNDSTSFVKYLEDQDYKNIEIHDNMWYATCNFIFTSAILVGSVSDTTGYIDRWCYHDEESARKALEQWDKFHELEPRGWHRHPKSGRRVDEKGSIYISH